MPIIILQTDDQNRPWAWWAESWEDASDRSANRGDGQMPGLVTMTLAEIEEQAADGRDDIDKALAIARKHGCVIEAQRAHDEYEFYAPGQEPPLSELVLDWLDRASAFTRPAEVREYLSNSPGSPAAKRAVRHEAEALGWIEAEDEEDA